VYIAYSWNGTPAYNRSQMAFNMTYMFNLEASDADPETGYAPSFWELEKKKRKRGEVNNNRWFKTFDSMH